MVPAVGIDLGTTKSAIGVWRDGVCRIIPDSFGHQSIPSLVLVAADERILAGRQAQKHPDRYRGKNVTISSVKRLMGRKGETGWGWWKAYPQEVSAFILAELKSQAERYLGEEIKRVVIAIPSHFDEAQRRATKEAAEIAGLEVVRLLNEATAAVLTYGFSRHGDESTLVFDFGGGTLDISVVEFGEGTYQVKSIEGETRLGGDDFDQVILNHIMGRVNEEYCSTIELDPIQTAILKEAAERAKVELSSTLATTIYIPGFLRSKHDFRDLDISLERSTFERISKHLVDRAVMLISKALNSAGVKVSDLDSVLLLGGTSRIPIVREAVRKQLGREPITGVDIETCVAQGAVIQAAVLQGLLGEVLLLDCIPSSYGIGLKGDVFSPLIPKNHTIPTSASQMFTTTTDNQSSIQITVYQGESKKASENSFLGTIELADIQSAPVGSPQIEVTFDVDTDMIVRVKARDVGTRRERTVEVKSPYGLNGPQIKVMHQRLKSWLSERRIPDLKSDIGLLISDIEKVLAGRAAALSWGEIVMLRQHSASVSETLTRRSSFGELTSILRATSSILEQTRRKIARYEGVIKDIDALSAKVRNLGPLMEGEEALTLLTRGIDLLKDCLERDSSFEELQKTFSTVHGAYEETKATLVKREIQNLRRSKEMAEWANEAERSLSDFSSVQKTHLMFASIGSVHTIVGLLQSEDTDCRASIQRKVAEWLRGDSYSEACFLLTISSLIDHRYISDIDGVPFDEGNSAILAFSIFNSLGRDKPDEIRSVAARAAASYLRDFKYIGPMVCRISDEPDGTTRRHLLAGVAEQSPGVLGKFFASADTETRAKLAADRDLLVKLAQEASDETRIFALQSLVKFPPSGDAEISALFSQALLDPVSKIRMLALEFLEREKGPSCLDRILSLLQSEKDEIVAERAIVTLCELGRPGSVPHLLRLLIERSGSIRTILLHALEKDKESMDGDMRRLFDLTKRIALEKRTAGFRDSVFLSRFSKRHPEMKDLVRVLKER